MLFLLRFLQLSFLIAFLSILCFSCLKQSARRSLHINQKNKPYDAIIVPGYPFQDSTWHDIMKIRVYWSAYLYKNGYTNNIIYSGAAVYTPFVESKIMKAYGMALGIPGESIFVDTLAKHSTENLYYSYQLAKKLGFQKIALATDPFQNAPLARFAGSNGIDVDFLPIVFDTLRLLDKPDPQIDYSPASVENFVALPDRLDFFERMRGTMGKKIDRDAYVE